MAYQLNVPAEVAAIIAQGGLVVVNHSGGKDSQAMMALLAPIVPAGQLLVVHAELPGEEWEGTLAHVQATVAPHQVLVATAVKTFAGMVEARGMFPSPSNRQCTSDLKRDPIAREVRRYLKANPQHKGLVVSAMGMRAQESSARAKLDVVKLNKRESVAGRTWLDWCPIHDMLVDDVFATIAAAGQSPHWAYAAGASRLSCMFCIMASCRDLQLAARLNPEAYADRVALEKRVGHTISMDGRGLEAVTGMVVS